MRSKTLKAKTKYSIIMEIPKIVGSQSGLAAAAGYLYAPDFELRLSYNAQLKQYNDDIMHV